MDTAALSAAGEGSKPTVIAASSRKRRRSRAVADAEAMSAMQQQASCLNQHRGRLHLQVAALSARRDELARQLADIAGRHATMVARNADMAATNAQLKQQALAACTSEEQWQQLMRSLPTPAYPPSNIYPTMPGWSQGLSSSSSSSSSLHPAGCLPTPLLPAPAAAPAMVGCVPTGPYIHEHQQQQQQQEQQRATWLSGGGCSVLHPCNPASPAATTGGCLYISAQRSSSLALNRFEAASDTRMSSQGPIKPESLSASDNSDRASPGVSDTITGLAPGLQWGSPVSQGQSLGYTSSCTNPSPLHTEQQQQQQQQQQQLEVHHGSRECVESVPQQLAQASWPAAEQAAAGVYAAAAAAAGPPSMASAVCTSSGGAGHTSVLYHSWQSVPGFRMQRPPPLEQVGGMGSTAVLLPAAALGGSRPMAAAAAGDHGRSSTSAAAVSRDAYQRALGVVHCDRYTALLAPLSQPPGLKSAAAAAEGPVGRMSSGAGMYSQQQPCSAATNGCFTQAYGSHRQGGSTDCVRPAVQDAGRVRPVGTLPTPQPLQLNGSHSSYRGSSRGVLLQWPSHLVGPMLVSQGQASLAAGHMLNGLPGPPACPLGKAGPYAVASTMPPQPPAVAAAGGRGLELWNIAAMQRRERSEGFDAGAGPAAPAQHPEHWATVATGSCSAGDTGNQPAAVPSAGFQQPPWSVPCMGAATPPFRGTPPPPSWGERSADQLQPPLTTLAHRRVQEGKQQLFSSVAPTPATAAVAGGGITAGSGGYEGHAAGTSLHTATTATTAAAAVPAGHVATASAATVQGLPGHHQSVAVPEPGDLLQFLDDVLDLDMDEFASLCSPADAGW